MFRRNNGKATIGRSTIFKNPKPVYLDILPHPKNYDTNPCVWVNLGHTFVKTPPRNFYQFKEYVNYQFGIADAKDKADVLEFIELKEPKEPRMWKDVDYLWTPGSMSIARYEETNVTSGEDFTLSELYEGEGDDYNAEYWNALDAVEEEII